MTLAPAEIAQRRTARLLLRRPVAADLPWLAVVHSDPANYEHAPGDTHTLQEGRELARSFLSDWDAADVGYWVVEHDGAPIGVLGLKAFTLAGRPAWNLYYRFQAASRGHGFAAEAGREALTVAALLAPERPVVARTRPTNEPARRLATALGLTRRAELDGDDGLVVYASFW